MINGQYINTDINGNKSIHSILYYINKENPNEITQDPHSDPQFYNWEDPVQIWVKQK
jgi:hypothetical protein